MGQCDTCVLAVGQCIGHPAREEVWILHVRDTIHILAVAPPCWGRDLHLKGQGCRERGTFSVFCNCYYLL